MLKQNQIIDLLASSVEEETASQIARKTAQLAEACVIFGVLPDYSPQYFVTYGITPEDFRDLSAAEAIELKKHYNILTAYHTPEVIRGARTELNRRGKMEYISSVRYVKENRQAEILASLSKQMGQPPSAQVVVSQSETVIPATANASIPQLNTADWLKNPILNTSKSTVNESLAKPNLNFVIQKQKHVRRKSPLKKLFAAAGRVLTSVRHAMPAIAPQHLKMTGIAGLALALCGNTSYYKTADTLSAPVAKPVPVALHIITGTAKTTAATPTQVQIAASPYVDMPDIIPSNLDASTLSNTDDTPSNPDASILSNLDATTFSKPDTRENATKVMMAKHQPPATASFASASKINPIALVIKSNISGVNERAAGDMKAAIKQILRPGDRIDAIGQAHNGWLPVRTKFFGSTKFVYGYVFQALVARAG